MKWFTNNSTNILASIYVVLVQIVAGVFHVAKIWTDKEWPVKCLIAIDSVSKKLKSIGKIDAE